MKILVTGAEGFIGKKLVSALKNKKHTVFKFDIKQGKNILNKKHLRESMKGIDVVFHLAAIIDTDNKKLWDINVKGTKKILQESINSNVKQFIFLSSTGVYGQTKQLIDEKSDLNPKTIYEESKVEAEKTVLKYGEEINVKIVRSAMVFGANEYWRRMVKLLLKGYPLPFSGKNSFQIIYVKNLINALVKIMEKGNNKEIYLAAGKERWTFREFCKKIKEASNENDKIYSVPKLIAILMGKILGIKELNLNNLRHLSKERKYNIKKIETIGYKQKFSLDKAIINTLEELKETNSQISFFHK